MSAGAPHDPADMAALAAIRRSAIGLVHAPPAGFGPWEQVRQLEFLRAELDDLPTIRIDWTHGDRHQTRFYIAHYPRPTS